MTKMVQLADDAYSRLKANKRPGESFSDVVRRLTRRPGRLADIAKIGSETEKAAARQEREKIDELDQKKTDGAPRRRSRE